ncbi:MAG: MFS transporter [Candidatus Rokubacteria bacterium]|nr:MFS transporter [Candidatus Rokubacteria bacterium]
MRGARQNARAAGRSTGRDGGTATRRIAAAGVFVISLDSMVNVAFPAMAAWFERPPEDMRWVIIPYVLSYSIMSFVGGIAADALGYPRVFRVGVLVSTVAFAAAAAAPAFGWLVAARILQGLSGGLVYGTAPGWMTATAPPAERGRVLGFLNAVIGLAFAVGPIIAGALIDTFGWQAIFAVRAPMALGALAWAWTAATDSAVRVRTPAVGARDILRVPVLLPASLTFLANAGMFAIWLLAPFYLVQGLGLGTFAAGALFTLTPLGTAVAAPLAGRVADRIGPRGPMVAGLALESGALLLLSGAGAATSVVVVAAALFAAGFGLGMFQPPNMSLVMGEFPAGQQGAAGGFSFMARTLGVVSGVAALSAIFAARRATAGFEPAFATAFTVAASTVAVAAVAGLVRVRRRGRLEP